MGCVTPAVYNIGIMIMIGAVNGIIVGFYMRTIHKAINKTFVKDAMGLFGPFLLSALLGTMVVTCSVLAYAYNHDETLPVDGSPTVPDNFVGWQLVYVGISAGIGLAAGLLTALLSKCGKNELGLASNHRYFSYDYGLWVPVEDDAVQRDYMDTNNQLKDKDLA